MTGVVRSNLGPVLLSVTGVILVLLVPLLMHTSPQTIQNHSLVPPTNSPRTSLRSSQSSQPSLRKRANTSSQSPSSRPSTQSSSSHPSKSISSEPSLNPTITPSASPSHIPSSVPTKNPTSIPSGQPSSHPSVPPTAWPSSYPSIKRSQYPSSQLSHSTSSPSSMPTTRHSEIPSQLPNSLSSKLSSSSSGLSSSMQPSSQLSNFPTAYLRLNNLATADKKSMVIYGVPTTTLAFWVTFFMIVLVSCFIGSQLVRREKYRKSKKNNDDEDVVKSDDDDGSIIDDNDNDNHQESNEDQDMNQQSGIDKMIDDDFLDELIENELLSYAAKHNQSPPRNRRSRRKGEKRRTRGGGGRRRETSAATYNESVQSSRRNVNGHRNQCRASSVKSHDNEDERSWLENFSYNSGEGYSGYDVSRGLNMHHPQRNVDDCDESSAGNESHDNEDEDERSWLEMFSYNSGEGYSGYDVSRRRNMQHPQRNVYDCDQSSASSESPDYDNEDEDERSWLEMFSYNSGDGYSGYDVSTRRNMQRPHKKRKVVEDNCDESSASKTRRSKDDLSWFERFSFNNGNGHSSYSSHSSGCYPSFVSI